MALFKRGQRSARTTDEQEGAEGKKDKGGWKRPANTAFKQQRLKAWQPILTPRTVLPTLFFIALLFGPIGGLLLWGSSKVSEITLEYTGCERAGADFTNLPNFDYRLQASDANLAPSPPQWSSPDNVTCLVRFDLPADLQAPVFLYYKLTNFYQNHRRYVRSLDTNQLKGQAVPASTLDNGDCKPLSSINKLAIYPCGLIANSLFNDTFSNPVLLNPASSAESNETYLFSSQGIAWPGEAKKYVVTPSYNVSDIVPPPNWMLRFPNGYNETNIPDLQHDEHFQNWMRTAGLPTFTKLYGRNDTSTMGEGTYQIQIAMNFPVEQFGGTKSIVISTVSWIGGKNPFLGWAYIATAGLFVILAIAGTIRHLIKPRKLGDMSLLSWNQPAARR